MARRGGCSGGQTPAALQADEEALLKLLYRWRTEARQTGREIKRVVVAYEAGRDGFWLARWLRTRGVEAYVIHPASIAVSREHRRAKTDRLDTELLMRAFLGWPRGEKRHCSMAAVPAAEEEDARRPNRERENLVTERTRIANHMKGERSRVGDISMRLACRSFHGATEAQILEDAGRLIVALDFASYRRGEIRNMGLNRRTGISHSVGLRRKRRYTD